MPKPTKGPRLGGTPTHERIILRNLATQLFEHGRITTTETKARRVQPLAERLITKAKRGDLHARRLVLQSVTSQDVVHKLFAEIAPAVAGRDGGYTRITKIGPRKGDNAPMAVIEIITEAVAEKKPAKKAEKSEKPAKAAAKTEDKPAEEAEVTESAEVTEAKADEVEAAQQAEVEAEATSLTDTAEQAESQAAEEVSPEANEANQNK